MTRIGAILRYKSSPGVRAGAWNRGPSGDVTAEARIEPAAFGARSPDSRVASIGKPMEPAPPSARDLAVGLCIVWRQFRHFCGDKPLHACPNIRSRTCEALH